MITNAEDIALRLVTSFDDIDLVRLLFRTQVGKRLLQLTSLAKQKSENHRYLRLLIEVQKATPHAIHTLLDDPSIILEARRSLGALAAAAAIIGKVPAVVDVESRDGTVRLPTLGTLRLAEPPRGPESQRMVLSIYVDDHRRVGLNATADGQTVTLSGDFSVPTPFWEPTRRLTVDGDVRLELVLATDGLLGSLYGVQDDFGAQQPEEQWRQVIGEGWRLLAAERPGHAAAIAAGLRAIVPVPAGSDGTAVSCTIDDTFGAVFMSLPADPAATALALVHEFQHAKLSAALDLISLHTENNDPIRYAPWRDDPRPLPALLQGIYAHLGVTQFWNTHRIAAGDRALLAHVEFARWRHETRHACRGIRGDSAFTPTGHVFVEALTYELEHLCAEVVPSNASDIADRITLDRAISWRLRNLAVDSEAARRIAEDWLYDRQPDLLEVESFVYPAPNIRTLRDIRTQLLYHDLTDIPPRGAASDADQADRLWARGHHLEAHDAYCERIRRNPGDFDAWAGAALTVPVNDPAQRAMRAMPEVVAEIYNHAVELGASTTEPMQLARWLASAM